MLYQYGFVPQHSSGEPVSEVFEDFGGAFETLIVQTAPQASDMCISVPGSLFCISLVSICQLCGP